MPDQVNVQTSPTPVQTSELVPVNAGLLAQIAQTLEKNEVVNPATSGFGYQRTMQDIYNLWTVLKIIASNVFGLAHNFAILEQRVTALENRNWNPPIPTKDENTPPITPANPEALVEEEDSRASAAPKPQGKSRK